MKIIFDTSALLSLAAGEIIEKTIKHLPCIIPERVAAELKGLARNNDFEGNLAKEILIYTGKDIEIRQAHKTSLEGEIECAYLAQHNKDIEFLITDDITALPQLQKLCTKQIHFSPIIVYTLYVKKKITKKQAHHILERMRVKRNWKDNFIFTQAKLLLEEL
jgi:rRNA-processing protein FCF1